MQDIVGVILAAGKYTRMNSAIPKMLHHICGQAIFDYLLTAVRSIGVKRIIVVTGQEGGRVKRALGARIETIRQKNSLGTGNAVLETYPALKRHKGHILVLYADTPLLSEETLRGLCVRHRSNKADCTLLTTYLSNPTGYGRIVRDDRNRIRRVVEEVDAAKFERAIGEVNAGAYCFRVEPLFRALKEIAPVNEKNEYYLTDCIAVLAKQGLRIESVSTNDPSEIIGVNTRRELTLAHKVMKDRILDAHLSNGVTIVDPSTTYIDSQVTIERDTIIYPFTMLEGRVRIGRNCRIGPFCRVRSGTVVGDNVTLGNFVEVAESVIGSDTTVHHHAFLTDCKVPRRVDVGAGTMAQRSLSVGPWISAEAQGLSKEDRR
ncbi:MAG: NTP transferase domain-containing protein [Candidatus Omnitrophica bacterium]|nr:NTP transferase domain-containing protein [Candidatus Omnitrophota bacterium]